MKPSEFLEFLKAENIMYWVKRGHIAFSGNERVVRRLYSMLAECPEFEGECVRQMNTPTLHEFIHELNVSGITYLVNDRQRIILSGDNVKTLTRCRDILNTNPELEASLILHIALNDPDLMDMIQERACIRWEQGYSDSLYNAVMCNIEPVKETIEYNDTLDGKQASFLRRMGFSEIDIMNKDKCPSAWIKSKPHTDWDAELLKYR